MELHVRAWANMEQLTSLGHAMEHNGEEGRTLGVQGLTSPEKSEERTHNFETNASEKAAIHGGIGT